MKTLYNLILNIKHIASIAILSLVVAGQMQGQEISFTDENGSMGLNFNTCFNTEKTINAVYMDVENLNVAVQPASGSFSWSPNGDINGDGVFTFSPTANETGSFSFIFFEDDVMDGIYSEADDNLVETLIIEVNTRVTHMTNHFDESCENRNDGSIKLTATGGTPGYSYIIDNHPANTTGLFEGLDSDTYNVTVTDANGCPSQSESQVTILEGTKITENIDFQGGISSICEGQGVIVLNDNSTSNPGVYQGRDWNINLSPAGNDFSVSLGNLPPNNIPNVYSITATLKAEKRIMSDPDAINCSVESEEYLAIINDAPTSDLILFEDSGVGENDDKICENDLISLVPNVTAVAEPFQITYNIPGIFQPIVNDDEFYSFNPTEANEGTISILVTDNNGCTATDEVSLNVTKIPTAIITMENGLIEDLTGIPANFPISTNPFNSINNESNLPLEILWNISNDAIVTDEANTVLPNETTVASINIEPTEAGVTLMTCLTVTDENLCSNKQTFNNPILSTNCNFKVTGNRDFCEGEEEEIIISFEYQGASENSTDPLSGSSELYLIKDGSVTELEDIDLIGAIDGDIFNYDISKEDLLPGQYSFATKVISTFLTCNEPDIVDIGGGFKVIDRVNIDDLKLSLDTTTFCIEANQETKVAMISGIDDIVSVARLYYHFSDPTGITFPQNAELLFINLNNTHNLIGLTENLGTNKEITLHLDRIEVTNDVNGICDIILDEEIKYELINCSVLGIELDIDNFSSPSINDKTEENLCDKTFFLVEDNVQFISGTEDKYSISHVLVEQTISSQSFDDNVPHIKFSDSSSYETLVSNNLDLEYFKKYFIHTIVEEILGDDNLVSPQNLAITFYPSPEHTLDIPKEEYCNGQVIEVSNIDNSKPEAMGENPDIDYEWDFQNVSENLKVVGTGEDKTFIYLDYTEGGSVDISSTLYYSYGSDHTCSSMATKSLKISGNSAPTPKKIYWWPGDILTSEEDSTMCFQWGDEGGDIQGQTKPYLFTETDGNAPSKFVNSDGSLRDFEVIYYVKTFERVGNSCPADPECYTQVFFDEEQFNSRSVEKTLDFTIVPNPASNQFYLNAIGAPIGSKVQVEIFDMSGQLFLNMDRTYQGDQMEFDISSISNGIYIVRLIDEKGDAINKKLVIH